MKTKFDPKKPISIHNPYPARLWPYRKGSSVLVLVDSCRIETARVCWYLPARKEDGSFLVTPGIPVIFCRLRDGRRLGFTNSTVAPVSRAGRLKLLREIEQRAGAVVAHRHDLYTAALAAWGAAVRAREEFEKNSLIKAC